ncbi:hypothetical protein [Yinghuangia seranimata]|uniref:hypothetical protein n=1 Tax=Yinghuangia seranimata TaxID=408067 RepID=UPI00248D021B|nr:hypothetical protein [Yinghuangia seranimata]MDI2129686.1 hypothetical protein [Yinghuangia seranimata]
MQATPGSVVAGEVVKLALTCPDGVHVVADGTSPAGEVTFGVATGNTFAGTLVVASTTTAGSYTITANCSSGPPASKPVTATTTVVVSGKPVTSAPHTGLGGSVAGMNSTQIAVGGALTAAAVGAGLFSLRRRGASGRA